MINLKSLEIATRKAFSTYTSEGPYHSYTAFLLYQNPARPSVSCSAASNVLTAAINPILGKRVTLTGLGVTGEKYIIPLTGNDFRLANTLADAVNSVAITVADGTGTVKDADLTADDTFDILQSYQVGASGSGTFLAEPPGYTANEKTFVNFYPVTIAGPVANLSHILYRFCPDAGVGFAYPSDVYGLATSTITTVGSGQTLRITAKPYMRIQTNA